MTLDVNVVLADMPSKIRAYTISNPDGSFTIWLNARLTHYQHLLSYHHEMNHIENGDYDRKCNINLIECHAHNH